MTMTSPLDDDSRANRPAASLPYFDPLSRIICADDFDCGLQGWTDLIGNYEKSLDSMLPEYRDLRGPMLSNGTMWDTGSAGSWDGTYAMKLATRPLCGQPRRRRKAGDVPSRRSDPAGSSLHV